MTVHVASWADVLHLVREHADVRLTEVEPGLYQIEAVEWLAGPIATSPAEAARVRQVIATTRRHPSPPREEAA